MPTMVNLKEREKIFLSFLRENNNREEINKSVQRLEDSDWRYLCDLATKNGLFPVFYSRLISLKLENIPPELLARLKHLYLLNLQRNTMLELELLKIVHCLEKSGISVIPLKGPTLSRFLYGDLALRQASCDLDLLVRYEAVDKTKNELAELGYSVLKIEHPSDYLYPMGLRQITKFNLENKNAESSGINLDLHYCIRGFFLEEHIQELWQNARRFNLNGYEIPIPSYEDLLIYLCLISITPLEFVQLRYLYDIHRLIGLFGKDLDWQSLFFKARRFNLCACLYFPLRLSQGLFLTNIPQDFLNNIKPSGLFRRLISIWLNPQYVLIINQKKQHRFFINYLLRRYLYSKNSFDFLRKTYIRIKGGKSGRRCYFEEESQHCYAHH
jgi:hypothetical protein